MPDEGATAAAAVVAAVTMEVAAAATAATVSAELFYEWQEHQVGGGSARKTKNHNTETLSLTERIHPENNR